MATSTLAGASMSLSFPLLSLALEARGVDAATIGWSAAGHGMGVLLGAPFFGRMIHRLGPTGTMQAGLFATALVVLVLPLHVDPLFWFVARLAIGAASAAVFVVSEAAVNALAEESRRGRILGLYASLFCIGYAAGPLIVFWVGSEGYAPFAIGAGLLLAGIVPARLAGAANEALSGDEASLRLSRLRLILRMAPLPIASIFMFGLLEAGQFALLPLYGLGSGLDAGQNGIMLSVWIAGNIVFQVPVGWIADRWSRTGMLALMCLVSLASLACLPWLIADPLWLWPLMLLMGASLGSLYTLSLALLGEKFRGADLAVANTGFIIAIEMGVMVGPPVGGTAMHLFGDAALVPTFCALLFLHFLVIVRLRRRGMP